MHRMWILAPPSQNPATKRDQTVRCVCAMLNRQMELTSVERIENHTIDVCTNPTFAKEKNQRLTFRGTENIPTINK